MASSWLKKWKLRADCDERRKMSERKQEENSNRMYELACGALLYRVNEP